jgi:hypothetical protein
MEDEERAQRIRAAAVRWTWASLAVLCLLGVLMPLTLMFRWWDASAICLLGLVTGLAVSYAVLHSEKHADALFYAVLALGLLVLPALAVFLSLFAASIGVFAKWNETLTVFVVYALATVAVCLTLAAIWRPREVAEEARSERVEELAEWPLPEGESLTERPVVELTPPVPPPTAQSG